MPRHHRLLTLLFCLSPTARAADDPAVLVSDLATLVPLEEQGLQFGARFPGGEAAASNAELYRKSAWYRSLAEHVEDALEGLKRGDAHLGPTMATPHRLFDKRWLASPHARFELAVVVNRLDRYPFNMTHCGETRLIYRLRYSKKAGSTTVTSRLPFTVNAVYWQPDSKSMADCRPVAQGWLDLRLHTGAKLVEAMLKGPLAPAAVGRARLKAVEINLQSVRWPSTTRPDLGAHAEYMLRVFEPDPAGAKLMAAPMENMPDVDKIRRDADLRQELLRTIYDHEEFQHVERGTMRLPKKFLAAEATSVSPRGLTRLANRPFAQIFGERTVRQGGKRLKSHAALMRRLDDMSCIGCHQARSVAGFHALGVDRADTPDANAIVVTGSPHLMGDLPRRRAFVERLAANGYADNDRPLSERADEDDGGYGSHCGLGDSGFVHWTCKAGFVCKEVGNTKGDKTVGQCFPAGTHPAVGDPCEQGAMIPHPDGRRDKVVGAKPRECDAGVCEANSVGFPEGMCAVACGSKAEREGYASCGSIAILVGFNACLAKSRPFTECLEQNVRPAGLRRCSDAQPCRDDYLCARAAGGLGACLPPYFLFQMRVDGHPSPL